MLAISQGLLVVTSLTERVPETLDEKYRMLLYLFTIFVFHIIPVIFKIFIKILMFTLLN